MAITDTITHGEESVINVALEKFGRDDPIEVIAFTGLEGGELGNHCGNCRDAIKQYMNINKSVTISAPKDGGKAFVVPTKVFFKSEFEIANHWRHSLLIAKSISQALKAEEIAYDIYSTESSPAIYGAAIVCENKDIFRGSFRGDVAYHPILPISAAITNFRDGGDNFSRKYVQGIVVASEKRVPDVLYKDRQHALEFAEAIQSLNNKSGESLPVYLAHLNNGSLKVYETNTYEWLPLPFSPKHLGMENMVRKGYAKLFD